MKQWLRSEHLAGGRPFFDAVASYFGWTTGNQITILHIALTPFMYILYVRGEIVWGSILYAVCCVMDFLDGAVSRYQQKESGANVLTPDEESTLTLRERLSYRGMTHLGKVLDPIADKGTYYGALLPLGLGYAHDVLLVSNVALAAALTLLRPIKQILGLADTGSNRFGKFKMWTEILVIASLVLLPRGTTSWWATNLLLAIATLLALLSLLGQLYTSRQRLA